MTRLVKIGLFMLLGFLVAWNVACNLGGPNSTGTGRIAGGGGGTGQFLFVADKAANRVLVYQSATLTTGQSAVAALGQAALNTGAAATVAANTLNTPVSEALDAGGNLWVSDAGNCRVVKFPTPFSTNESATIAIGQPNLATSCAGVPITASVLGASIGGIAFDASGNLWVADTANNRVLGFTAGTLGASGPAATGVLGQANFTSNLANRGGPITASTLSAPTDIVFDTLGNMWVVDEGNNRVLGFTKASVTLPVPLGPSATGVIGQPGFVTGTPQNPDASHGLNLPTAAAFDPTGNLWVADTNDNRVVEYTKATVTLPVPAGPIAVASLGSAVACGANPCPAGALSATSLDAPTGIVFDSTGRAIVADTGNNRTLVYPAPAINAEAATIALGQASVSVGNAPSVSATGENSPTGVATTF